MKWEENVRRVVPYIPGEQPKERNIIKLNTNENPYPPSPEAQRVLRELTEDGRWPDLRLYPDTDAAPLVRALAEKYDRRPEEIYVGVGSDDVLAMCFLTFFCSRRPVLFPDITYSFYDVWAELYGIPYEQIPLDENFCLRKEDYFRENGGIIFPNPNAPTGVELPVSAIEEIAAANPGSVVIIDEAYVDFGAESALPLIDRYDNLMVVQTFSKSRAMAGMRIGYAMANERLIRCLRDVRRSFNSYTMNLPSILCGAAAVRDDDYFRSICGCISETRERFEEELSGLGFRFCRSRSNFVFARHPDFRGEELYRALRERGILIRWWNKERISDYLRITIGTSRDMREVARALRDIVEHPEAC
ncbi:pyridoxal phosphate-dependent aminotransferase [Lachnoclostridium sp. Marseille-P6806]|uniref:pyridoxal phosphate-dependent aminotransferase n=1 Tax=Lachnoclostridium sp. Marseille-P6806 TaxID=2364793 RepID=UPI001031C233|nr:histidinol-phosphate transaminase [Lachnoclostridium sp. Marseille-P6806]